jgi:succinoglycan biosynthesis transport protein ExoP
MPGKPDPSNRRSVDPTLGRLDRSVPARLLAEWPLILLTWLVCLGLALAWVAADLGISRRFEPIWLDLLWPRYAAMLGLAGTAGLALGMALALYRSRAPHPRADTPDSPLDTSSAPAADPAASAPGDAASGPAEARPARAVLGRMELPAALMAGEPPDDRAVAQLFEAVARDGEAGFRGLAGRLTRPAETEGAVVHLVFGTATSAAIAAVSYGLSRALAAKGVETLLLDASLGAVTTGSALVGRAAPGILDVALDDADPASIGKRLEGTSIVLVPAASPLHRHAVGEHGEGLVETVRAVADGFGEVVIDLGPLCPPELFNALLAIADDALMVVDAAEAGTAAIASVYADLRELVPELRGMVVVDALPSRSGSPAS